MSQKPRFEVDSQGITEEAPIEPVAPGNIRLQVGEHAEYIVGTEEGERHFYVDREGHRVLDIEANEWTQLDPETSAREFIWAQAKADKAPEN